MPDAAGAEVDEGEDERVHRLTDITTREVSLVDRAANGHRFLLIKRSDEMGEKGQKVEAGEDGELTAKEGTGDGQGDETTSIALDAKVKKAVLEGVEKALGLLGGLKESVSKAEEAEGAELPEDVGEKIVEAAKAVVDAVPGDEDGGVDVEKVGRKMSAARMRKLRAAFKTIEDLLKEVGGFAEETSEEEGKKDAKKRAEALETAVSGAVEKALEAGLAPVVEALDALQKGVEKNAAGLEEVSKARGSSQQAAGAADDPPPKKKAEEPQGFRGGDLNRGELPKERRFD